MLVDQVVFEKEFQKTEFYINLMNAKSKSDDPVDVYEKRNGKYRNTYIQMAYDVWLLAKSNAIPVGYHLVKDKKTQVGHDGVDFSVAPKWAKYWVKEKNGNICTWSSKRPLFKKVLNSFVHSYKSETENAPDFGYSGDWKKSLTSRKAMIESVGEV